jgi:cell division protein FtsL
MMRLLNLAVIAALVLAAADVYTIKLESARQSQRLAKLRMQIRREQDAIAVLRAQWAQLDAPARIQGLAQRHLTLHPIEAHQYDKLDNLPPRRPALVPAEESDPIGMLLAHPQVLGGPVTGSLGTPRR